MEPNMTDSTSFPVRPSSIPLPTWATGGSAVKADPGDTKRKLGWVFDATRGECEVQRMDWVNNELYNSGTWYTYFDTFNTALKNLLYPIDSGNNRVYPTESNAGFLTCNLTKTAQRYVQGDTIKGFDLDLSESSLSVTVDPNTGIFTVNRDDSLMIDLNLHFSLANFQIQSGDILPPYDNLGTISFSVAINHIINTQNNVSKPVAQFSRNFGFDHILLYEPDIYGQGYVKVYAYQIRSTIIRNFKAGDTFSFTVPYLTYVHSGTPQYPSLELSEYSGPFNPPIITTNNISSITIRSKF
jgi:hypothetical protein